MLDLQSPLALGSIRCKYNGLYKFQRGAKDDCSPVTQELLSVRHAQLPITGMGGWSCTHPDLPYVVRIFSQNMADHSADHSTLPSITPMDD